MFVLHQRLTVLCLLPMLAGISSCTPDGPPHGAYHVNTIQFMPVGPPRQENESIPGIWIDTNTQLSGWGGGTLASSLPGSVMIDYTDSSHSVLDAVITDVRVRYEDAKVEADSEVPGLPLRIAAREYESVNSVTGGRIVKSKNWIVSGKIPDVITRAEPFRLQMEGYFSKDDGTRIPFTVDQRFDVKTENTIKRADEVLQDK